MKILMEHIPRTIFGVKYNIKTIDVESYNKYQTVNTKNEQIKLFNKLSQDKDYSEVKMIRWHINANDEKVYESIEVFADDMFPNAGPHKTVVMSKQEYEEYIQWKKRTNGRVWI